MTGRQRLGRAGAACSIVVLAGTCGARSSRAALPSGVRAVWDLVKAHRESTPTRERVCINGLWRWQPASNAAPRVPAGRWGHFKVPGPWPGISSYNQKDCQTVHAHSSWRSTRLGGVTMAWYQREIQIPAKWAGRRIAVYAECVNNPAQRAGLSTALPIGELCGPRPTARAPVVPAYSVS